MYRFIAFIVRNLMFSLCRYDWRGGENFPAKGRSTVRGIGLIDRGYENFQDKLEALGAEVVRG